MDNFDKFVENFSDFILSASGFRKVFALSKNEEDDTKEISLEDSAASALIAYVFSEIIKEMDGKTIAIGMDSRPTGSAISKVLISVFEKCGLKVLFSGITAAPEFMAWIKTSTAIDGFAYISASHNPIGHNGFKFGFSDGAVMGGKDSIDFISKIVSMSKSEKAYNKIVNSFLQFENLILPNSSKNKKLAEEAYRSFSNLVITGTKEVSEQKKIINKIKKTAANIGIIAELNGSARGVGIDKDYFNSYGIKTIMLNNKPGQIVHRIVPEGNSLELCQKELEAAHAKDPSFILGYVPDNDGDRGNIVYFDDNLSSAKILEAQEVFALCVKAELDFLKQTNPDVKTAVVVNGPTSMRIEKIAATYNAKVFRAEVGEANVVGLAAQKRKEGYNVRILGEGSNGGNITHPATVRDPLNTIFAIIKLISFCKFNSITEAVESLPAYSTTGAYEPEAKMQIGPISHAKLKENYESIFPVAFEKKKKYLYKKYGINGWYEINYEGIYARKGIGKQHRTGAETGGLKIVLTSNGRDKAFLWMRGSGTEPVFRVMSDFEGDNAAAMYDLLSWQRSLVEKSCYIDSKIASGN